MFSIKIAALLFLSLSSQVHSSDVIAPHNVAPAVPVAPALRYRLVAPQNIRPFAAQVSTFSRGLNVFAAPYAAGVLSGPAVVPRALIPGIPPVPAVPVAAPPTVPAPVAPVPVYAPAPAYAPSPAYAPGPAYAPAPVYPAPVYAGFAPAPIVPAPSYPGLVGAPAPFLPSPPITAPVGVPFHRSVHPHVAPASPHAALLG